MSSLEQFQLTTVVQTVSVLEAVVVRSFGPEGGHVLVIQDTGQAKLTRHGTRILKALQLQHPVARMVVECVSSHGAAAGDGSKTFVLLLASLLRLIQAMTKKQKLVSREAAESANARHWAEQLLVFAQTELSHVIDAQLTCHGGSLVWTQECVQKLLASFLSTRLGDCHSDLISDVTSQWIHSWTSKHTCPILSLHFLNDRFPALTAQVAGFPITSTRLIQGQLFDRDFSTPPNLTPQCPVKAVVFAAPLLTSSLDTGDIFEGSVVQCSGWLERSLQCAVTKLQTLGVCVIVSAVRQPDALLSAAARAGMGVVQSVSPDQLSLFLHLTGSLPVWDCRDIQPQHVAVLSYCRSLQLGAHRYVHYGLDQDFQSWTLVICAPGDGQTDHYATSVRDGIRMLLTASSHRSTMSPVTTPHGEEGLLIAAGGTFEFLLSHALVQSSSSDVAQLLAKALLVVPRHIHSPQRFLDTQSRIMSFKHSHPSNQSGWRHCCPTTKGSVKDFVSDFGLESVSCKYQLMLAVLQCLSRLLQVDTVLHVSHTQSKRSPDHSEDQADY